jgi:hypothetical protein
MEAIAGRESPDIGAGVPVPKRRGEGVMTHKRPSRGDHKYPPRKPDDLPEVHEHFRTRWERRRTREVVPPEYDPSGSPDPEELEKEIQEQAIHKHQERSKRGLAEDRVADRVEAEQEVMALWMRRHAHPHAP